MTISMLEKLGSDASLHRARAAYIDTNISPKKQWCLMVIDDSEEPEIKEEEQDVVDIDLH